MGRPGQASPSFDPRESCCLRLAFRAKDDTSAHILSSRRMDEAVRGPGPQQRIDAVMARVGDMPAAVAGMDDGMVTPAALAADLDLLAAWLETQGIAAEQMDARTRAAYMLGGIS